MNKKGGAIVEAAMVFPVMLLAVIAVLHMLIYFYNQVDRQAELHMTLRLENGAICNNLYYENQPQNGLSVYRKGRSIYSYDTIRMKKRGLLEERETMLYAEKYLIDDTMVVRMADIVRAEGTDYE